jgi:DNA-binding IclR family transcriptional regulator
MPHATTERRLQQLIQAGWVYRRGTRYFLRLERLEEPAYAIYFTHAERAVAIADKKLQAIQRNTNMPKMGTLPSPVA